MYRIISMNLKNESFHQNLINSISIRMHPIAEYNHDANKLFAKLFCIIVASLQNITYNEVTSSILESDS